MDSFFLYDRRSFFIAWLGAGVLGSAGQTPAENILGTDKPGYVSKMHVAAAMQQRLVLFEYSKVRGDVDLYQVLSLSAVLRSLLRLGAEFEIFAGCGTVCCSSKITMTMARDLRPSLPLQRRTCGL